MKPLPDAIADAPGPVLMATLRVTDLLWMAQEIRAAIVIFPRSRELLAPVLIALSAAIRAQEEKT